MEHYLALLSRLPAAQQPEWEDDRALHQVRDDLAARPALVRAADVHRLRSLLARAASGAVQVIQAGDCAEDPEECTRGYVARKAALLDLLAGTLKSLSHKPVLRVGRIAGQFAKPRSRPTETVAGRTLAVYRGHLVNSPEPDPLLRRPDPRRLLTGYDAASSVLRHLGWHQPTPGRDVDATVWTSHEALVLDYELPQLREDGNGSPYLASTHWPWIGERTRQVDGAHVALHAAVVNPVACKVGPGITPEELLALCDRLDPHRDPGRLTLIARMGAAAVSTRLPRLVRAARQAGHPVLWLCDPMHGNTVSGPDGLKTRFVETVVHEVEAFYEAVAEAGGTAAGLHLETTPDDVAECLSREAPDERDAGKYTSFCDPRLNPAQAMTVAAAWRG
ncbi:3-deoxy-7-phosphoheptulonate synthase [Streptomyces sp. TRM72054]|uniref:3-deoxy-7-phosphoheptulonate synthase n=1 Tax=Streptomyces sp. TRM72054 TaxID=2870562 RepID=UPI001C8B4DD8|nr:3-deoxy-7-phosphoheptulonate synthase [Streptomyces sp. TRM72054]MBX9396659.1 3-deoxy-7-phosphoheptulonate synthase [Streptomyces sp. TRM72054]